MPPKAIASDNINSRPPRWWILCIGFAIIAAFIVAGWYAGLRSGTIQQRRWNSQLLQLTQELAATKLAYEREKSQLSAAKIALRSTGKGTALNRQQQLQRQVLKIEADAETCKEIVDRQQLSLASKLSLVSTLSQPDVRLVPMKGMEATASSVAYAVITPKKKLIVIATNLPKFAQDRQMQVWILRTEDPKFVSAGLLSPAGGAAVIQFTSPELLSDIASIAVTDEPLGGSPAPTGQKLFVADVADQAPDS